MVRFVKAHGVALSIVGLVAAVVCFAYVPMWRAWPEVVPTSLRGIFIAVSMPWSWATLTSVDAALWKQSLEANVIVPELLVAMGFGFNVAVITALTWFGASRHSGTPATASSDV